MMFLCSTSSHLFVESLNIAAFLWERAVVKEMFGAKFANEKYRKSRNENIMAKAGGMRQLGRL